MNLAQPPEGLHSPMGAQWWPVTMRSYGSSVSDALSRSSLYSISSHRCCRVLRGSFSSTGMETLDRSLPMLFLKIFHRLMLLVSGHGAGRHVRRPFRKAPPVSSPFKTAGGRITMTRHCYSDFTKLRIERLLCIIRVVIAFLEPLWYCLKGKET